MSVLSLRPCEQSPSVQWMAWGRAHEFRRQVFSLELLSALHEALAEAKKTRPDYLILHSEHPDFFSQGGDILYFSECIERGDADALRAYGAACLDIVSEFRQGLADTTTLIALVQGRALGGGFEAALSADLIVAEEHSKFCFPEIKFGLFPCSGGMSLLAGRVGLGLAERMMREPRVYTAAELYAMGLVDVVCPTGTGRTTVQEVIAEHRQHRRARLRLQQARKRMAPWDRVELDRVVDEWVADAVTLEKDHRRALQMLVRLQQIPGSGRAAKNATNDAAAQPVAVSA